MTIAYLAPEDRLNDLLFELEQKGVTEPKIIERLVICESGPETSVWAQNIWYDVETHHFESIKQASTLLRERGRNWALYPTANVRRARLIEDQLPHFRPKLLTFPTSLPSAPVGAWTLLDDKTLLCAAKTDSPMALGEYKFVEDKISPPSRAYLKLWEALTRLQKYPNEKSRSMDLGACPGGWSWVLLNLGSQLQSIDKAPLDPKIMKHPNLIYRQESAFGIEPKNEEKVDWLFSDIICYPPRLLNLVQRWIEAEKNTNFVFTIKFQGETDTKTLNDFLSIEGSYARHLYNNKHEVTWFLIRD
ncbi:MAG: hypothetical protein COW00_10790 [Bdellovibrio sp. CG12_big_fil_rev_8_21_14_0_65_39_13]|nr:MAG: hypothetical protein COW78_13585 [Bdellovibrio sp. CG22_combo_CG10-13_8_21_14_all_39_27]PIQ59435.1 MAG: hypothetical protein COW00_10790 [Bdellovibrio sp. CG12_big_fil_rev_8_21_14_0_65_39_13]PIR34909.1 MAG: hypothetical protein COV37_11655 [Bdellovibrio sp. CG11_big_fil_rev_8_21_14_0_20_39_38]PJB53556.1 MAG: hypothetical protein CO099_06510 [Bdellovibrio sp. CG_4_9_14_3_um_filter_39_7]